MEKLISGVVQVLHRDYNLRNMCKTFGNPLPKDVQMVTKNNVRYIYIYLKRVKKDRFEWNINTKYKSSDGSKNGTNN